MNLCCLKFPIYLTHIYKMSNNRISFFFLPVCLVRKSNASYSYSASCTSPPSIGLLQITPAMKSGRRKVFFCDVDIRPLDAALSPPTYFTHSHSALGRALCSSGYSFSYQNYFGKTRSAWAYGDKLPLFSLPSLFCLWSWTEWWWKISPMTFQSTWVSDFNLSFHVHLEILRNIHFVILCEAEYLFLQFYSPLTENSALNAHLWFCDLMASQEGSKKSCRNCCLLHRCCTAQGKAQLQESSRSCDSLAEGRADALQKWDNLVKFPGSEFSAA